MQHKRLPLHLKEQFLREFTMAEQMYFLKKAHEAIISDGYVPGENLYHYCYFLTLKERIQSLVNHNAGGLLRYLVVEGTKDVDEALKIYKERLEKNKRFVSTEEREQFIRYLEEPA